MLLENRDGLLAGSAYENRNFIENTLIIWLCLLLTVLFLPVLFLIKLCCCKQKAAKGIKNYKFNVFIRFFLIFYLPIVLACQVNAIDGKGRSKIAYYFGMAVSILMTSFTLFVISTVTCGRKKFKQPPFKEKFGTLIDGLKEDTESVFKKAYYAVHVVQRLILAMTVAHLTQNVNMQLYIIAGS